MTDLLQASQHLPEIAFEPGATIVAEGTAAGGIFVLVSGALRVLKGDVLVNTITRPGALVGEVSVLLGSAHSATVEATERSVLRHAEDGRALLTSDPAITLLVAAGLAERLNFVTTYLADLKHQYGDAPGLAMVPEVLRQLSLLSGPPARAGSARDPDPDY
ncbi:MAG TPA: cyclic nucleotide-binding domain-containing protein [Burkholderiaceae bacterium]|nr:cyclic nucleotide-binding domain-containing protein [Burkholderiaceae bacterium]